MTWVSLIVALLQLANRIYGYIQEQGWIREGEERQIAKATAEILRKSEYAKQALAEFNAMPDSAVDDFLRGLGRDSGDGK